MRNIDRAQALRKRLNGAERRLWQRLRRLDDRHFRRQVPIGPFIVDFACLKAKLIIEVDGPGHASSRRRDGARDAYLSGRGYRVLRIPSDTALWHIEDAMAAIQAALL